MTRRAESRSEAARVTRTFAMSDVIDQYRALVTEAGEDPGFIHDTLIIGGGVAGAGVLRDLASRGNASAILVDRGPFGAQTSSKTGKAIHPGIRYLRMAFHRLLLAFRLRQDPRIRQSFLQNLRGAWLDLQLVWYGTRERKILIETTRNTVEEIPNIVLVLPDSPERKWAVFFGISLYDLFTTLWAWSGRVPRSSGVKRYHTGKALHRELPNLAADHVLGGIRYWDGKANNDKVLVLKAIRDAYYRGSERYPIRALSHVEVEHYDWRHNGGAGYFEVTLARRFEHETLPEAVVVRAHTITNAAGPWVDQARNRTSRQDERKSVVYSRGSHLEATNRFIHQSLTADPRTRVGLVPLNQERQHYLRPFQQNGIWYIQCTTTDRTHEDPDLIVPLADEVEELLQCYNELVSDRWRIDRRDIFHVFCGIRPLASSDGGEIAVSDISRMFRVNKRAVGRGVVYDLVNVKLTEFRWAGRAVGEQIAKELRRKRIKTLEGSTTHRLPFLPVAEEELFALNRPDHPSGDREFLRDKVGHYVRYQLASSYEDYLLNSGGIRDAVIFDEHGRCELDMQVLDLLLTELGTLLDWDQERCLREWAAFKQVYTRNMAHAELGERVREHVPALAGRPSPGQQADAGVADPKQVGSAVATR